MVRGAPAPLHFPAKGHTWTASCHGSRPGRTAVDPGDCTQPSAPGPRYIRSRLLARSHICGDATLTSWTDRTRIRSRTDNSRTCPGVLPVRVRTAYPLIRAGHGSSEKSRRSHTGDPRNTRVVTHSPKRQAVNGDCRPRPHRRPSLNGWLQRSSRPQEIGLSRRSVRQVWMASRVSRRTHEEETTR